MATTHSPGRCWWGGGCACMELYGCGRLPLRLVFCGGLGWVGRGPYSGRAWLVVHWPGSGCVLCRPISTSQLVPLLVVHFWPIHPVVCWGPSTPGCRGCGDLVLEMVSRLDAFSGYPSRTWPTSRAPGGTTGTPEVRPSRSSRTRDRPPQVSCARRG